MFSVKFISYRSVPETKVISDPHGCYKIVDEFTQQDFAKNYGGHPRSDVALLNEQQDLTYVNNLLNRLNERPSDGKIDISDKDLSIAFKSKYCQTASEKIAYYENIMKIRDERELDRLAGEERDKRAAELQAQRDALRNTLTADEKEYLRKKAREKAIDDLID